MKRCPECKKDYRDDSLLYCLDDGAELVQGSMTDEPATAILSGDRASGEDLTKALHVAQTTDNSLTLRLPAFLSLERLPWLLIALLAIALVGAIGYSFRGSRQTAQAADLVKSTFHIQPPARLAGFGQIAISPDGKNIAVTASFEGRNAIWLRPIDSLEGRRLAGTEGVVGFPFWSGDGRSIGFFIGNNKIKRIDLADGTVTELGDAPQAGAGGGIGGTWNRNGTILFNGGAIARISATGGAAEILTGYEPEQGELFRWPSFLPDGKHFLFLRTNSDRTKSELYVGSIDGSERKLLFASDSNALYSPSPDGRAGHLIFARGTALLAQGFDPDTHALLGEPFRVAERVRVNTNSRAFIAVSDNGTLVYDPSTDEDEGRQLTWYDRAGKEIETVGKTSPILRFKLSPDERSLIMSRRGSGPIMNDLLVADIARGASSRLSSFPGEPPDAVWSPDGKFVVWNERANQKVRLVKKLASGAGETEVLFEAETGGLGPTDWSPDGRFILYHTSEGQNRDVWVLPMEGDRKPFPYIQTPFMDWSAVFSPDGKYVAYRSNESGRDEIYIQTFPASANKWPVSTNGGISPSWSRTGRDLFYVQHDGKVMSVDIKPGDPLEVGTPQPLFDIAAVRSPRTSDFAVSNDGKRLLFISRAADAVSPPIVAVLNWSAGLNR
jgi:Tol biopolymer transport system component